MTPVTRTRVELCGPLRLHVAGADRSDLPGARARALVAYLVWNRHRAVSRHELIDVLWGSDRPQSPEGALSTLLTRTRKDLGPDVLRGRERLEIDLGDDPWIDIDSARAALEAPRALDELRKALKVLGPPLLPEVEGEWVERARDEVEELRAELLEAFAEAAIRAGGPHVREAEKAARTLAEAQPFRESAYVLQMRAAAAGGDVAEALRIYDHLRLFLREELGTSPGHAAMALHEELLRGGGGMPTISTSLPAEFADGERPFVGREIELARLRTFWASEKQRVVVVAGPSGVGKTALCAAFARSVHEDGAHVLYGRCDEVTATVFQPFAEALGRFVGGYGSAPSLAGGLEKELAALIPALGTMPERASADPATHRHRLFEAVALTLRAATATGPVLIVIDDVQWADLDTLLMLRHVLRATASERMCVLATSRPDVSPPPLLGDMIEELRRADAYESVSLAGLSRDDATALVISKRPEFDAVRISTKLWEWTQGHPLFLLEALDSVYSEEATFDRQPAQDVTEAVVQRVLRLGLEPTRTLELAAVIGVRFAFSVLEEAANKSDGEVLLDHIDAAVAAGLVRERTDGSFEFFHALVRDALYARQTRARRERAHARVAQALEKTRSKVDTEAADLAWHFFEARGVLGTADARRYSLAAAAEATRRLAFGEAATHLERAAGITETQDTRLTTLLDLGDALERSGEIDRSRSVFAEAFVIAELSRNGKAAGRAAAGFAKWQQFGTVDAEAIDLLERALRLLDVIGREGCDEERARLTAMLAVRMDPITNATRRESLVDEALAIARAQPNVALVAELLRLRTYVFTDPTQTEERLAAADETLRLAVSQERPEWALWARLTRFLDLFALEKVDAADEELDAYEALAGTLRHPWSEWHAVALRATRALFEGRLDEGKRLSDDALAARLRHDPGADEVHIVQRAMAARARHAPEQAPLDDLRALATRFRQRPGFSALYAIAAAEAGDSKLAAEQLEHHGRDGFTRVRAGPDSLAALGLFAETAAFLGNSAACERLYSLLEPLAGRNVVMAGGWAAWGSLSRQLALVARAVGSIADAERNASRARAENTRMRATPWIDA